MSLPRVLIIDDDSLFTDLLVRTMVDVYEVKTASDVWLGVELLDSFKPVAIVLDVLMPAASGLSFLQEIASYADTSRVPVLICSSIASQLNLEYLQEFGVRRLLDKSTMQPSDVAHYLAEALAGDVANG